MIVELNENGLKRQSYIHANGTVIAQQRDNQVQWVHMDPLTRSLRESATDGNLGLRSEFDPLGHLTARPINRVWAGPGGAFTPAQEPTD